MRRILAFALIAVGFGGAMVSQWASVAGADGHHAVAATIDGAIQPSTASFLERVVREASEGRAQFVVIRLDTPGGLYDATRDMVETLLESTIPVVVYVSPAGAQAASAGTFIAAAGHVAAMTNGTNIGAASPVDVTGEDLPETIESKATNDAAAFLRSIAEERGRNVDALESTVTRAQAYSAMEALDKNVVDIVAMDLEQLLEDIDGREVELPGGPYVIRSAGVEIREIEQSLLERFLAIISNPNIAFLLLIAGAVGIFIEFWSPGLLGPGILGVICLALAFVAFGNLPVNWAGVGLIALAMILMYVETQTPGFGIFGASGVISLILGAVFLFGGLNFTPSAIEGVSFRVNYWLVGGVSLAVSGLLLFVARDIRATQRIAAMGIRKGITTPPSILGANGIVTTDLAPNGMVQVEGEEWSAVSDTGETIEKDTKVVVLQVDGLTLKVTRDTQ